MTKRNLIKWLEKRASEAGREAIVQKNKLIEAAQEEVYKEIGLDEFINQVVPLYKEILDKYDDYLKKIDSIEGVRLYKYNYKFGYNDLTQRYTHVADFRETMKDTVNINTQKYNETVSRLSKEASKVVSTYDTVILTVKNLPSAKDGLEYLKKLGFDLSEIEPIEKKKQLPATTNVNVDVKYLLLKMKSEEK